MIDSSDIRTRRISISRLSAFYSNIAVMAHVGISLDAIFLNFYNSETDPVHKEQFKVISNKLKHGQKFIVTLKQIKLLPEFDLPLWHAAIEMGRIPDFTRKMAQQYEALNQMLRQIRGQLLNPFFTLLLALLIQDFPDLMSSAISLREYSLRVLPNLVAVFFASGLFFWVWMKSQYSKKFRRYFYSTFGIIPGLNKYVLLLAIQRFSLTLESALETGMDLYQSLELAGESAGFERVRVATKRLVPMIKQGMSLETALKVETVFPKEFIIAIDIGLNSGRMPEAIQQYRLRLEIEIEKSRNLLMKILPTVVQVIVGFYVCSMIFDFYKNLHVQ